MQLKKIVLVSLLIIIASIGLKLYAQSKVTIEQKVKKITEKMTKRLNLNEEQKIKVYKINLDRSLGHEEAYKAGRKKELIMKAVEKWQTDLKEVLTQEQQEKLNL
jgi:hypothetical protein